jgi:hypothetical protein
MGVPTLEVGYTSATTGRGDHEVHKGHVVALEKRIFMLVDSKWMDRIFQKNDGKHSLNLIRYKFLSACAVYLLTP